MKTRELNRSKLIQDTGWTSEATITMFFGLLFRVLMLMVILYVTNESWEIFYLEDDKKYEEMAQLYRAYSDNVWNMRLFNKMTAGYASAFWPLIICVFTKICDYVYTGRIINVLLSTLCIGVTYKLCYEVAGNQKTALLAARLFAYMPFSILVCCFPIKDIFIMLGTMYAFFIFVRVQNNRKVTVWQYALLVGFLFGILKSRGAVTELLLIFFFVYWLQKTVRSKKYIAAMLMLVGAAALFVVFRDYLAQSFGEKIDTYGNYGADEAAGLNIIRITGVWDFYKLPITYGFAMLQPMKLALFNIGEDARPWQVVMSYANITMYPVAVGAWAYMFCKKHNLFFWLSGFVMFAAIISLSLGVSRHYLFMLPIHMINYSLYMSENTRRRSSMILAGTIILLVAVVTYASGKIE